MADDVAIGSTPSALRLACRVMLGAHLPTLGAILSSPASRDQDKIKSLELLGKFGLGAAGNILLGVIALPALGETPDYGAGEIVQPVAPQALTPGQDP